MILFNSVACLGHVSLCLTAVCLLFLLKLKWPKNKSAYDPSLLQTPAIRDKSDTRERYGFAWTGQFQFSVFISSVTSPTPPPLPFQCCNRMLLNNYWMRFFVTSRIFWISQKPNLIIVLLYIEQKICSHVWLLH